MVLRSQKLCEYLCVTLQKKKKKKKRHRSSQNKIVASDQTAMLVISAEIPDTSLGLVVRTKEVIC